MKKKGELKMPNNRVAVVAGVGHREVQPGRLDPRAIARVVAQAVSQPRDTSMHEFDVRPSVEIF
jgi:NADP-dependent 3-hydroxy acid dehydrogenase YdfG